MQREAGGSGSLIDGLACGQRFRAAVPVLRRFAQTVRPEPAQRPTVGSDRNVGGRWNFLSGCVHGRLLSMGSSPNGAHLRSVCQALIQTRLTSPEAICRPCQWLSQRSADRASGRHSSSRASRSWPRQSRLRPQSWRQSGWLRRKRGLPRLRADRPRTCDSTTIEGSPSVSPTFAAARWFYHSSTPTAPAPAG